MATKLLKRRIVLTLIYSAGLRGRELINLKISDIDFDSKAIHIRQGKLKLFIILPNVLLHRWEVIKRLAHAVAQ